jgi:uncharacterized integral membrane protein
MRVFVPLIALFLLALGFAFGALNPSSVPIDLFGLSVTLRLGLALLLAALAGALGAGLLLALVVIWPQQRRLRRVGLQLRAQESPAVLEPERA